MVDSSVVYIYSCIYVEKQSSINTAEDRITMVTQLLVESIQVSKSVGSGGFHSDSETEKMVDGGTKLN